MEDQSALIVRLRQQLDTFQYSLDSLGAAERLSQRGRIEDTQRQLRLLAMPAAVAPAGVK